MVHQESEIGEWLERRIPSFAADMRYCDTPHVTLMSSERKKVFEVTQETQVRRTL